MPKYRLVFSAICESAVRDTKTGQIIAQVTVFSTSGMSREFETLEEIGHFMTSEITILSSKGRTQGWPEAVAHYTAIQVITL